MAHNSEIIFKAIITQVIDVFTSDDPDCFYMGPDHENFSLEVIQGEEAIFLEWFTEMAEGVCRYGYTGNRFMSLGGCQWKIATGSVIEVTRGEFIKGWLEIQSRKANRVLAPSNPKSESAGGVQ